MRAASSRSTRFVYACSRPATARPAKIDRAENVRNLPPAIVWLPAVAIIFALLLASRIPTAESTIELLYARPVDLRTKALILTTAWCGPIFGWTFAISTEEGRAGGRAALFAALCAALSAVLALVLAGIPARPAVTLASMSALEAATLYWMIALMVRTRMEGLLALLICAATGCVALLAVLNTALGFIGVLVPTYWIGDMLVAEQLGQESRSAGLVGLSLHLLPLSVALGLAVLDENDSET